MRGVIEWEDPPPPIRGVWGLAMHQVKQRPGVWALVGEEMTNRESYDGATVFRRRGFEAASRKTSDQGWSLWARWPVPESKSGSAGVDGRGGTSPAGPFPATLRSVE